MTTSVLDRIPLDEITEQAREVKPGRALLTVVAGVLFGLGWIVAKVFGVAWLGFTWSWVAVREGWRAAHGPSRSTRIAQLEAQVEALTTELRRLGA